ncbi:MAG: hypothetical protein GY833_21865 [Aestuariibacter sp.]|nr:hypothetical protein [Aestuariibacter sp.]
MCDVQTKYKALSDKVVATIPAYRDSRPSQRAKAPWNALLDDDISHVTDIPASDFASRMNSLIAFKPSIKEDLEAVTSFLPEDAQQVERYFLFYHSLAAVPHCKTCGKQLKAKKRFRMVEASETNSGYGTWCNIKCMSGDPDIIEQRKATNVERLGVDSPAKSKAVRDKMQSTLKANHGVTSPIHSDAIKAKHRATNKEKYGTDSTSTFASKDVRIKRQDTIRGRYGVENIMEIQELADKAGDGKRRHAYAQLSSEERVGQVKPLFTEDEYLGVIADRVTGLPHRYPWECLVCGTEFMDGLENDKTISAGKPRCPSCNPKIISYGENEILKAVRYACPEGTEIKQSDRELLDGKEIDILVPSLKLAIEYNGIFWHSAYAGDKDKAYHQSKLERLNALGYRLMYVWEDELYKNPTAIKQMVMEACGHGKEIDASKADIVQGHAASEGMETYHREGSLGGTLGVYSLVRAGEPIAVLQVAQRPRKKKGEVSRASLRYKVLNGYKVDGGFQRLLDEVIQRTSVDKLYEVELDPSFDDVSVYKGAGFELAREKSEQMWYLARPMKYKNRLTKTEFIDRVKDIDPAFNMASPPNDSRLKSLGADRVWGVKRQVWQLEVKKP